MASSIGREHIPRISGYIQSLGPAVVITSVLLGLGYYYLSTPPDLPLPGPDGDQSKVLKKHFQEYTLDQYLKHIRETYGPRARVKVANRNIAIISDADISQVMYSDMETFQRPKEIVKAIEWMCDPASALFGLEGDVWQKHRRSMIPAFSQKTVKLLLGASHEKCNRVVQIWKDAGLPKTVNIHVLFTKLTLDIIGITLFGYDFNTIETPDAEVRDAVGNLLEGVNKRCTLPKALWFLIQGKHIDEAARRVVRNKVDEILRAKATGAIEHDPSKTDMVDLLMQDGALTHDEMIGEMFGLLFAGHETSSNTLTIIVRNILQNPGVKQRVQEEVDASGIEDGVVPDARVVAGLRYIDCVIKETLRINPVIASFGRRSLKSVTIKGITYPKGTTILPDMIGHHLNEDYFSNPTEFTPDRWLNPESWLKTGSYIPFGDGGHRCIGERLAMAEMRLIIAKLFRKYDFELAEGQDTTVVYRGTARIPNMQVVVNERT